MFLRCVITLLFSVVVFELPISSDGAAYTAMTRVEDLFLIEKALIHSLDVYIAAEKTILERVEQFSKRVGKIYKEKAKNESEAMYISPPQIYSLIRRFVHGWAKLGEYVDGDHSKGLLEKLEVYKPLFPTLSEDLYGSISALFILQDTYNITAKQMASGEIPGSDVKFEINADDCFEVGSVALYYGRSHRAQGWLNEAYERSGKPEYRENLNISAVLQLASWVEYINRDLKKAVKLGLEFLKLNPKDAQMMDNIVRYRLEIKTGLVKTYEHVKVDEDKRLTEIFGNTTLNRLCREERIIELRSQHHLLKCRYISSHPLLVLKPAKEEVVLARPIKLIIFRDFVPDKDLEEIKQLATPHLSRSVAYNLKTGVVEEVPYRISENTWLDDDALVSLERFNAKAEAATGLAVNTAEYMQVANYGFGGQYEEHHDHGYPNSPLFNHKNGNRLATLLLYLSDVPFGGGTAFTSLKTYVRPNKGDAVFWYNLKRSCVGNNITLHAACPVLSGVKWVGNKWFHMHGQEFRRPCLLHED